MANAINKTTLEYKKSVNTPDYSIADWILNPTLPSCPKRYWKISGDTVVEMSQAEKNSIDATELELLKARFLLGEQDAGRAVVTDWVAASGIVDWSTEDKLDLIENKMNKVIACLNIGCFTGAAIRIGEVTPSGELTQAMIDDLEQRILENVG